MLGEQAATEDRNCIACGGSQGHRYWLGEWPIAGIGRLRLGVRICANCGAVFQDPAPKKCVMDQYYRLFSNYTNAVRQGLPPPVTMDAAERQVSMVRKAISPGRAFEVGCATGYTLAKLKDAGWQVAGCDPSETAVSVAMELWGIDARIGSFEHLQPEGRTYDLVIFSHVLEHLYEPVQILKYASLWLTQNGRVLIEVPCLSHPEKWPPGYFTLEHVNYFTPVILSNCLCRAGFAIEQSLILSDHPSYPVMTVIARRMSSTPLPRMGTDSPELMKQMLDSYRRREMEEWDRINRLLKTKLRDSARIVIWGAGIHTSQLLANTDAIEAGRLTAIVDSDPQKIGLDLNGVKVVAPENVELGDDSLAIVISSRASESEIFNRLSGLLSRMERRGKLIPLYSGSE